MFINQFPIGIIIIKILFIISLICQLILIVIYHNICVDFVKKRIFIYLLFVSIIHAIAIVLFDKLNPFAELIFISMHLYLIAIYTIYPFSNRIDEAMQILQNEVLITPNQILDECLKKLKSITPVTTQFLLYNIGRIALPIASIASFLTIFISIPEGKQAVLVLIFLGILLITLCIVMFAINPALPIISDIIKFIDYSYYNFEIQSTTLFNRFADGSVGQLYLILGTHFIIISLTALTVDFHLVNGADLSSFFVSSNIMAMFYL